MRRLTVLFTVLLFALALPLADASAKMGKSSFGSRGARTIDRPIERSLTPPPAPPSPTFTQPQVQPRPQFAAPQPGFAAPQSSSFFQRHPMMSGFMGGLVGAGIGSMLFGHSAYASYDAAPGAGILGLLVQLAIVGGLIWLGFRLFRGSSAGRNGGAGLGGVQRAPIDVPYEMVGQQTALAQPQGMGRVAKEFEPTDQDKGQFAQILIDAQRAWSTGDLAGLRRLGTPEVVSWLSEDLTEYASRGERNLVEDVQLVRGEISEAWRDGNREFATAVLTYTARDHTVRVDTGAVVDGNPSTATQTTEAWTFVRAQGGKWLVSAVER